MSPSLSFRISRRIDVVLLPNTGGAFSKPAGVLDSLTGCYDPNVLLAIRLELDEGRAPSHGGLQALRRLS